MAGVDPDVSLSGSRSDSPGVGATNRSSNMMKHYFDVCISVYRNLLVGSRGFPLRGALDYGGRGETLSEGRLTTVSV